MQRLNAEQNVTQATSELEYARKLANRGYVTRYEVQRRERELRDFERALALAEEKLKILEMPDQSGVDQDDSPQKHNDR